MMMWPGAQSIFSLEVHDAFLESGRRGDHFESRARLVEVLHCAIAPRFLVGTAERIRVECRPVRQRENLA